MRKTVSTITDAELSHLYNERDELALLLDVTNGLPTVYRISRVPFVGTVVVRSHQIEPVYNDAEVVADAQLHAHHPRPH